VIPVYLVTSPTSYFIFAFGVMCFITFLVTFLLEFLIIIKFRLSHRWDDKTEVNLTEGGRKCFDWIPMAQNTEECRSLVNKIMNVMFPQCSINFLGSWGTTSIQRGALICRTIYVLMFNFCLFICLYVTNPLNSTNSTCGTVVFIFLMVSAESNFYHVRVVLIIMYDMVTQGSNFQYSGLVLERQTLLHYRRRIRFSNWEPYDVKLPFLLGSGHGIQWEKESNRV
jgi:hypothetical protein